MRNVSGAISVGACVIVGSRGAYSDVGIRILPADKWRAGSIAHSRALLPLARIAHKGQVGEAVVGIPGPGAVERDVVIADRRDWCLAQREVLGRACRVGDLERDAGDALADLR